MTHPMVIFCFWPMLRPWMVGMGKMRTAKSETMLRTDWASATFLRQVVVPALSGLQGTPAMLVRARV